MPQAKPKLVTDDDGNMIPERVPTVDGERKPVLYTANNKPLVRRIGF